MPKFALVHSGLVLLLNALLMFSTGAHAQEYVVPQPMPSVESINPGTTEYISPPQVVIQPQQAPVIQHFASDAPTCCPPLPPPDVSIITDIIVLVDSTVSMSWFHGAESRLSVAQWLALDVADSVPDRLPTALVALFDEASEARPLVPFMGDERAQLRRSVMRLRATGDGKLDKLLNEASRLLSDRPNAVPLIVLVTDGVDCDPFSHGDPIRNLKKQFGDRLHFQVFGICDNTLVSAKLRDLASQAGTSGDYASVRSYSELPAALSKVRATINAVQQRRDVEAKWCSNALQCCFREVQSLTTTNQHLLSSNTELSQRVQELSKRVRDLEETERRLQGENASLTAEVEKLVVEVRDLTFQVKTLTTEKGNLILQVTQLTNDKEVLKGDVTRLTGEKNEILREKDLYHQAYLTWFWLALAAFAALLALSLLYSAKVTRLKDALKRLRSEVEDLKRQLTERTDQLESCRSLLEEAQCSLKAAEEQIQRDATEIASLKAEVCRLNELADKLKCELAELNEQLECCQHHLRETQCKLKDMEEQNRTNLAAIADLRIEAARLEEKLASCKHSGEHLTQDLQILRSQNTCLQSDLVRTQQSLHDSSQTITQQQAAVTRLTGEAAAASAQANQLNLRVQELQFANVNLQAQLSECKTGRAAADEKALGATREMAANKKDCCCPPSNPAIYNPVYTSNPPGTVTTVTPTTPTTPSLESVPTTQAKTVPSGPVTTPMAQSTPSTPSTQSTPSTPSTQSTPSTPSTQSTPSTPSTQSTPSTPSTQSTPSTPTAQNSPQSNPSNPQKTTATDAAAAVDK